MKMGSVALGKCKLRAQWDTTIKSPEELKLKKINNTKCWQGHGTVGTHTHS